MANTLALSAAVNIPNINRFKIGRVTELDEDNGRMVAEIVVLTAGGMVFSPPSQGSWRLEIANGGCDALVAHPAPAFVSDSLISARLQGAGVASAFTTALAAYRAAGGDKRGNLLTALQGIIGTVAGGPLNGTSQPILPAGVVS